MIKLHANYICDLCGIVKNVGEISNDLEETWLDRKTPPGWVEPLNDIGRQRQHICESCMQRIDDGKKGTQRNVEGNRL